MYIYLIQDSYTDLCKIGSSENVSRRLDQLKIANPNELQIIKQFESKHNRKVEFILHTTFKHKNVSGEWFELNNNDINSFVESCAEVEKSIDILIENNNPFI